VWKRHLLRTMRNFEPMEDPTDEEKHDAIKVLADPENAGVPGLWVEAHRIFDETSK
jgi:hypothetical protein